MSRQPLHFKSASRIVGTEDVGILLLLDENEERQLVITCDNYTLHEIGLRMSDGDDNNRRLPEALWDMLVAVSNDHYEVYISGVDNGQYTTYLVDTDTLGVSPLKASEGVLLAVARNVPIFVDSKLLQMQGMPYDPNSNGLALPVNTLSDEMLQDALDKAVNSENYELAAYLRDEMRHREARRNKSKQAD